MNQKIKRYPVKRPVRLKPLRGVLFAVGVFGLFAWCGESSMPLSTLMIGGAALMACVCFGIGLDG